MVEGDAAASSARRGWKGRRNGRTEADEEAADRRETDERRKGKAAAEENESERTDDWEELSREEEGWDTMEPFFWRWRGPLKEAN